MRLQWPLPRPAGSREADALAEGKIVEANFEPKVVEAQAEGEARGAGIDASVE